MPGMSPSISAMRKLLPRVSRLAQHFQRRRAVGRQFDAELPGGKLSKQDFAIRGVVVDGQNSQAVQFPAA